MKKLALAAALSVALAGAASAADMPARTYSKAPAPMVEVWNWTGFYIGGQVGGAWSDHGWDNVTLTNEPVGHTASSVAGGGHIGYNWQFNQIVFGIEAEASATDLNGSSVSRVNPNVTYSSNIDWYATIVGRLGFAFGRAMVYGTGGVAFTEVQSRGLNAGLPDSFATNSQRTGWTVGVGLAYQITPNWIAGIDYKHLQFDKYNAVGVTALAIPYTITGIDTKIDQVTARISYKFGGPVIAKY